MIIVLIGRSGSGKSVIAKRLMEHHGYTSIRTATTRDRRDGEPVDAYYFMTKKEFMNRMHNDEFVEWAVYNDNCYGTLKSELQKEMKQVIVLTPEGAESIKKVFPNAFVVYVEVDLKTSVQRAIGREESLTISKLQKIAMRGCTDDFLYKNTTCDFVCKNPDGINLDDIAEQIVNAHEEWIRKQEVYDML